VTFYLLILIRNQIKLSTPGWLDNFLKKKCSSKKFFFKNFGAKFEFPERF